LQAFVAARLPMIFIAQAAIFRIDADQTDDQKALRPIASASASHDCRLSGVTASIIP
jgi:hypothetical protein